MKKNVKRTHTKQMQKEQTLQGKLNKLFDIAQANAMSIVGVQNDEDFLMDQTEERKMMIGKNLDKVIVQKLKNKESHLKTEERPMKKPEKQSHKETIDIFGAFSSESSSEEAESEDYVPAVSSLKKCPTSIAKRTNDFVDLRFLKKNWLNNVALMADKNVISTRQALEIAASCLMPDTAGTSKCTPDALTMSASTLHRRRKETRSKSDEAIKELFSDKIAKETLPHFLLHWMEKTWKVSNMWIKG